MKTVSRGRRNRILPFSFCSSINDIKTELNFALNLIFQLNKTKIVLGVYSISRKEYVIRGYRNLRRDLVTESYPGFYRDTVRSVRILRYLVIFNRKRKHWYLHCM
jgi:hypothetical protein